MRYALYEDPLTHLFGFLALPRRFVEGDELSTLVTDRWFGSREEALTTLPALLDLEDLEHDPSWQELAPIDARHAARMKDVPNIH